MTTERTIAIMKNFLGALLLTLGYCSSTTNAQDFPFQSLSNELIWYSGEFRSEYVSGVRSMNDGKHYTSLERTDSGSAIVKYAYQTGEAVDTIATSLTVFQEEAKGFDDYEFSADESHLLITTETEGIYRHSFYANYYTHNLLTSTTRPLSDFEIGKQRGPATFGVVDAYIDLSVFFACFGVLECIGLRVELPVHRH